MKLAHDIEQVRIVAQVLRGPSAHQYDSDVIFDHDFIKGDIGLHTVALPFDIGIPARLKIMHNQIQSAFRGSGNIDLVFGLLKSVHRVESFVGLAGVAGNDEDLHG